MANTKNEEKPLVIVHNFSDEASWKKTLNSSPKKEWTKTRNLSGSSTSTYVPYAYQQAIADYIFRMWEVISENYVVIHNEILCTVKLQCVPDYPGAEIRYMTGSAAKPIQADQGSVPSKFPLGKKANALEYNTPAVRSSAVGNALETFGNIFGRNLNRDVTNNYKLETKSKE